MRRSPTRANERKRIGGLNPEFYAALAKFHVLLHYYLRSDSISVKNMPYVHFYFFSYFSYSSPTAVEKR